jgi:hypothetical protein
MMRAFLVCGERYSMRIAQHRISDSLTDTLAFTLSLMFLASPYWWGFFYGEIL